MIDLIKFLEEKEKEEKEIMSRIKKNTIYVYQKGQKIPFLIVYPKGSPLKNPEVLKNY